MKTIQTIADYCRTINIAPPRHGVFDIRRFEDNMKTVNARQSPFRHEFYAIALRSNGDGTTTTGSFTDKHDASYTLFFNSPYQEVSWDIELNWEGYYILFGDEFMERYLPHLSILNDYPYFRIDQTIPMQVTAEEARLLLFSFEAIFKEYQGKEADAFSLIAPHTRLLMEYTRRCFCKYTTEQVTEKNRAADVLLVSRLKVLLETSFKNEDPTFHPHSAAGYAEQLRLHPNHLNAVVKRITGKTVKALIQETLLTQAKTLLYNTDFSNKEIAHQLHFDEPSHFNALFKKLTGLTPVQLRNSSKEERGL